MDENERKAWEFFREVCLDPEKREALRYLIINTIEMKRLLEASRSGGGDDRMH